MGMDPFFGRRRGRRASRRHVLGVESLETRQLLAADGLTPTIGGTVFQDANSDGQPSPGEGLADVTVRFYVDDGDGIFEPNTGDVLFGGNTSTDANGAVLPGQSGSGCGLFHLPAGQTSGGIALEPQVSPLIRPGLPQLLIDSFISTQSAAANPPAPSSSASVLTLPDESEVIGQERDMMAFLESGDGEVRVNVNPFGNRPTLRYNADVAVTGSGVIVWDGQDSEADSLAMGLNGLDLTQGGTATGIVFRLGAVAAGATASVRLYQGNASNFSEASLAIPITTGGAAESYELLPFTDFVGSVQPDDVDAIELMLNADVSGGNDIELALIGANGPKTFNILVNAGTDLSITKSDNRTSVVPGETLTYTVVVSNNGPSDVTRATVTDTLPAALTDVSYTSSVTGIAAGNTASGTGDINDMVNMSPGSSITYTITGTVSPNATGTLTNTATVTPPDGFTDPDLSNNSAVDADSLAPHDLVITKSDNVDVGMPGRQVTYTITATNDGPSDVVSATVSDAFPASLTNVSYTSSATLGASGNTASGTGDINDTVDLEMGSSITYTVTATIASDATGSISNTAQIVAHQGTVDPDTSNNSATDTDSLSAEVDLRITKTDNVSNVQPGQVLNYTIVVANDGPADVSAQGRATSSRRSHEHLLHQQRLCRCQWQHVFRLG